MGFPSVSMKMPQCFGINFLLILITYFKIAFTRFLTQLCLLKPQQQAYTTEEETINYVLIIDRLCPTPIPVPVNILTALIKRRLPVTKFHNILHRLGKDEDKDEECICPVCADSIKNRDEIRELCNCSHVFHKDCLDKWVDEGQVTCPLCRSMLFPENMWTRSAGGPWMIERSALFSGGNPAMGEN